MIVDANTIDDSSDSLCDDIVIVGAGTVGLLLAKCLADAGRSVAIVETGNTVAVTTHNGNGAQSVGKPHTGVLIGRAAGLGGTSVLWSGELAEFQECDLVRPGLEWPLNYQELCNWYQRTYEELGLAEQRSDQDYQRAFGIIARTHPAIELFFTSWLPQPNFAILLRRQIFDGNKIRIFLNATANDIQFDGSRAVTLHATTSDGRYLSIKGNAFIFAAGTIANAQFFLTTRRRPNVPWRSNSNIGRYFQDHLGAKTAEADIIDENRFRVFFENGLAFGRKLKPKLRFTRQVRAECQTGVCGEFFYRSSASENIANVKALVKGLRSGLSYSGLRTFPTDVLRIGSSFAPLVIRYVKDRRILAIFDRGIDFQVQAEQLPISESRIRVLDDLPDRTGLLTVGVNWQVDGMELDSIRQFMREADAFLQENGLARLRHEPSLSDHDGSFLNRLGDTFHQCGGLRMGSSSSESVTNTHCRVWDTQNVYVAGASVLPTSSYANCTLTALALGVRLADHLRTSRGGLGT